MRVSRKTDYALRVLVTLACHKEGGLLSITRLAKMNDVPRRFLEQIMIELRQLGWVTALTGRGGGFALAINPAKLSMGRVIRHFDSVLAPIGCVSVYRREPCSQEHNCRFRRAFLDVRNHTAKMLDNITLADLMHGLPVANDEIRDVIMSPGEGI